MGLHQTKNVFYSKENHQQIKRQPTESEKILANGTSNKGLISEIDKKKKTRTTQSQKKNNLI